MIPKSVQYLLLSLTVAYSCTDVGGEDKRASGEMGWAHVEQILTRIREPEFADRNYRVSEFGAISDGKTDCRPAINNAIDKCNSDGGGRVVLVSGDYYCKGPINLKSNVSFVS